MFEHIIEWFHHDTALVRSSNPLLVLAVLLITGYICAKVANKFKIPLVTVQILGGLILGHHVLNIFLDKAYDSFVPITNFALGFIGLTIGSHLDFRKLHNAGKRIFLISFLDLIFTFSIVYICLILFTKLDQNMILLIAVIAITTAPGSTLHIVKEKRAKGIFTKTLLAVVALNNVLTILLFYVAYFYLFDKLNSESVHVWQTIFNPFLLFLESIIIGGAVGFGVIYFTEKRKTKTSFLTIVVLAVVLTVGSSEFMNLSSILSCLILGIVIANFSKYRNLLFGSFKEIEAEVFSLFFVLAGAHLDLNALAAAGLTGLLLIVVRIIGKTIGPTLGAFLAGSTSLIKKWIGISLYPIAGVAIGLMMMIRNTELLSNYATPITSIILTAVIVNELIGPFFTGRALRKSGEEDKNRLRLMDFIQEEFIRIDIDRDNKWEALEELAGFLYRTHKCHEITLAELKSSLLKREKELSTGIGNNLAIPHAIIEGGPNIIGVIGISRKGIEFDSFDNKPVHIIFMIATPRANYESQHLQVLSNIAKIFGHHPHIKDQIIKAKSPEEIYGILQAEEVEELNPFFEN